MKKKSVFCPQHKRTKSNNPKYEYVYKNDYVMPEFFLQSFSLLANVYLHNFVILLSNWWSSIEHVMLTLHTHGRKWSPTITNVMSLSNLCTFNLKHCCRLLTINWLLNAFLNICRIICLISSSKNNWSI
jgi:hypothetical protein